MSDCSAVIVVKSNHPNFKYALLDSNYKFIGNLKSISEASKYYKCEKSLGVMQIKRDLGYVLDMKSTLEKHQNDKWRLETN